MIMGSKLMNVDFVKELGADPNDLTLVLTGPAGSYLYRATIGPITEPELPRFPEYNAENHLDPARKEILLGQIIDSLPDVSIYSDLDVYTVAGDLIINDASIFLGEATEWSAAFAERTVRYIPAKDV